MFSEELRGGHTSCTVVEDIAFGPKATYQAYLLPSYLTNPIERVLDTDWWIYNSPRLSHR